MNDEKFKNVTWEKGNWSDITSMLEAHYEGTIDISDYWKTGDRKMVQLNNGEFVELVLIGSKHDDLIKGIGDNYKTSFTIQTKNCLTEAQRMFGDWKTQHSLWSESDMRDYLNNEFKKLLPRELQILIKPVIKETYRYACKEYEPLRTMTITQDDIFLLSEKEVYGTQLLGSESDWGRGSDGTQYEYYKIASNRIKYLGINGTTASTSWLRSSVVVNGGASGFRIIYKNGNAHDCHASGKYGVAPAFCI